MEQSPKRRLFSLVSKLHDQSLSEDEKRELEAILEKDPEARKCYYELTEMELCLQDDSVPLSTPVAPRSVRQASGSLITLAKVAALLLVGSFSSMVAIKLLDSPDAGSQHLDDNQRLSVGIISDVQGNLTRADSGQLLPHTELTEGHYQLLEGNARFDFFAGVSVELEAPGSFSVISPVHMEVQMGKLAVEVHDARSMFKITSSKSAYVDLGTEFSINVDEDGSSELHVYEGSVLASSLSKLGNSERIQLVKEDQTLTISGESSPFSTDSSELSLEKLPRIKKPRQSGLHLNQSYAGEILKSNPDAYWSFADPKLASTEGSLIESTQGPQRLIASGNSIHTETQNTNTFLQFEDAKTFAALAFENLVHFAPNQSFSVEFWIRPDRINRATVFAVYDPKSVKPNGETDHLALIDLMHTPISFHHVPAAIRAAIRPVPSDDYYSGINMFTNEHYIPGQWMHIAFVKGDDYAATYINGAETNRVSISSAEHTLEGDYAIIFGQMSEQNWDTAKNAQKRPFVGAMDEIAFYKHALTPDEVASHYRASR